MRIRTKNSSSEEAWLSLLSQWSGYQLHAAEGWMKLLGLEPAEVVWRDASRVADGLRLKFEAEIGFIWVDLSGSSSTRLRVALRWMSDDMPMVLHGEIYSQSSKAQWFLAEPIIIDYLPTTVVSDHDWYDFLVTKIYNDNLQLYIRNFYRLLVSPSHQFMLLEATHLADVEHTWKRRIPGAKPEAQLLKPSVAEMQFLNFILPQHSQYDEQVVRTLVCFEKEQLFKGTLNSRDL